MSFNSEKSGINSNLLESCTKCDLALIITRYLGFHLFLSSKQVTLRNLQTLSYFTRNKHFQSNRIYDNLIENKYTLYAEIE